MLLHKVSGNATFFAVEDLCISVCPSDDISSEYILMFFARPLFVSGAGNGKAWCRVILPQLKL